MPETGQEKVQKTRTNRLANMIQADLAGKAAKQVTVKAALTGAAAEMWAELREDATGLEMNDRALLVALLNAGYATLRKALRSIPRDQPKD